MGHIENRRVLTFFMFFQFAFVLYGNELRSERSHAYDSSEPIEFFDIPNDEIILIWEHSCMKHIEKGEMQRAREVKETIDWQRANKKFLTIEQDGVLEFQQRLKEAQAAKAKAGEKWGCNPPPERLRLVALKIGSDNSDIPLPETFLSSDKKGVGVEGMAEALGVCQDCQINWSIDFPKQSLHNANFENRFQIKYTHEIVPAPMANRGDDFKILVAVTLLGNGKEIEKLNYEIKQDELDQLRQEYMDMEKKKIPSREELIDSYGIDGRTQHFNHSQFNSSEMVGGGSYRYILSKILDKLEQIRAKAGNVEMTINSGFRNPYKNARVPDSTKESTHLYGIAVDVKFDDFNKDGHVNKEDHIFIWKIAKALNACVEPEKKTPTWVHIDWRGSCPQGW